MNMQELKKDLHKQIDALHNETALQLLHEAAVDYNSPDKHDILNNLTQEQRLRLDLSVKQSAEGNTIPHEEAMQLVSKWRNK